MRIILSGLILMLGSCHHKDLIFDDISTQKVEIQFDWRNAQNASPASMSVYMFGDTGGDPLRYEFVGRDGGEIKIPIGNYTGIAINSDNNDWARFRNKGDKEAFELYTAPASVLEASGISIDRLPSRAVASEEIIVKTPDLAWASRSDSLTLNYGEESKIFMFYPEEIISRYTVDVINIDSIGYLKSSNVDMTLSGMAAGWHPGRGRASDTHTTFSTTLKVLKSSRSFHGEFYTFGENPENDYPHKLTLYIVGADGKREYATYDVTDQVRNAPDPRNVHIVIKGFTVRRPTADKGGLDPHVDDWEDQIIDIQM